MNNKMYVFFLVFCGLTFTTARECCPSGSYVIKNKFTLICSDKNQTNINLNCQHGKWILNPNTNENEDFMTNTNNSLLIYSKAEATAEEFCVSKLQRNGTKTWEKQIAVVCFLSNYEVSDFVSITLRLLMLISTLFLLITLYIYLALPNLRDLQGKCMIAFIFSLMFSYLLLFIGQTFPPANEEFCVMKAAVMYFFLLAYFFWSNVNTFNIWKSVRNLNFNISKKVWFIIYISWGFGIPVCMVFLAFVLEHIPIGSHIRPKFGEVRCWFKGDTEVWTYFYGPVAFLLTINVLMFIQTCWILWKSYKESTTLRIRSLKFKCAMYLKLFLLMGLSWLFEVISNGTSFIENAKYVWFVTDCLNCSQGIFIFLFLVVFRQKVRLGLLEHKLFNIKWPESWAKEELQESLSISAAEELELANQKNKSIIESQKEILFG